MSDEPQTQEAFRTALERCIGDAEANGVAVRGAYVVESNGTAFHVHITEVR